METRKIVEQSALAYYSGGAAEAERVSKELNFGAFKPKIEALPVHVALFDRLDAKVVDIAAG